VSSERAKKPRVACVFCNGTLDSPERAKRAASHCDLLLAADGGMRHLAALNLEPEALVGDMDSVRPGPWSRQGRIVQIPHPPDKGRSDTEIAVEYAFQQGCDQVVLVAATGGRLDHTLANVALAAHYPGRVAIFSGSATLVAVDRSEKCVLNGLVGTTVSLIPYGPDRQCIRTTGLKYSLGDEALPNATRGLSNELVETHGCVCVSEGILLVYIESGESCPTP